MSRPRLRLVHSSTDAQSGVVHRRRDRNFQPSVIKGGRLNSALAASPWEAGFELINLGFLASWRSYLACLEASMVVLEACNPTDLRSN
jgi:hypothetical protein